MSKFLQFLTLFSLIPSYFCNPASCSNFFLNTSNLRTVLSDSARRPFDLGLYDSCISSKDSQYFVLFSAALAVQMTTGLCVPNYCTVDDMNSVILPKILSPISPFFNPAVVTTIDPKAIDNSLDSCGIAILAVLALLVFLSLSGSIYKIAIEIFHKKPEKHDILLKNDEIEEITEKSEESTEKKEAHLKEILIMLNGLEITEKTQEIPEKNLENTEESLIKSLMNAFSLENNLSKVFTIKEGKLDFFNFLRALSLFYVVFGHEFLLRGNSSINPLEIQEFFKKPIFLLAAGGFYAVDVFYYLSGFFLAFVILQENSK